MEDEAAVTVNALAATVAVSFVFVERVLSFFLLLIGCVLHAQSEPLTIDSIASMID